MRSRIMRGPATCGRLENKIKGAVIMAEGKQVTAADLGLADTDASPPNLNLREVRRDAETRAIRRALASSNDNVSQAAKLLGITRPTLYDLMEKYGVQVQRPRVRRVAHQVAGVVSRRFSQARAVRTMKSRSSYRGCQPRTC